MVYSKMDYVPTSVIAKERNWNELNATSFSDILIQHVKLHVKAAKLYKEKLTGLFDTNPDGVQALTAIAVNSMVNSLRLDPSRSNIETVLKHAPPSLLPNLLANAKLHYTTMLQFAKTEGKHFQNDNSSKDLFILKNEYFLRSDGTDWGLCTLDDADIIFADSSTMVRDDNKEPLYRCITRKLPPTAGLAYLDQDRPRTLKIQPSTAAFKKTFDRLMNGCLQGLDWTNVFVAGGMALSTLLCVDESMDKEYMDNDIDMYIYGLSPDDANKKVRHICEVWTSNLKADEKRIMVKNAKTITLLSTYPHRRIQIILRMVKCPASVLLNFDLDQAAIGYTGESVLYLPRCARALETGYTIFTLDMIYGHHLNERRETQEERLFKYSKKGFGVRILPEFCSMINIDFGQRSSVQALRTQAEMVIQNPERNRSQDPMFGLQAVRRVFCLGEDMVHRFYLGRTEMSYPDDYDEDPLVSDGEDDGYSRTMVDIPNPSGNGTTSVVSASFSEIDTYRAALGAVNGKKGLAGFETHARHCAFLRFEKEGKMKIDYNTLVSVQYDTESYDDLPKYHWNAKFSPDDFVQQIEEYHGHLFGKFSRQIEEILGVNMNGSHTSKFRGYLTRRIRRMITSTNLDEMMDRYQLVIPVTLPFGAEEWLKDQFAEALSDAGIPDAENHPLLIPVHKKGMGDGSIPDLEESTEWNTRYWVIDSTTIWAGIDRRIDEIYELLWSLFQIHSIGTEYLIGPNGPQEPDAYYGLLMSLLLRRVTKLSNQQLGSDTKEEDSAAKDKDSDPVSSSPLTIPNERDKALFTRWLMEEPVNIYRNYQYSQRAAYREDNMERTPPSHMYWREGVDGTSNEWTEWKEGEQGYVPITKFTKITGEIKKPGETESESDEDAAGEHVGGENNAADDEDDSDDDDNVEDAEEGEPVDAPRGVKRRRETTDLSGRDEGVEDDSTMDD